MAVNCYARRGWGEINPDLVRFIAKKLHDVTDFISLRAVCKGWRAATSYSDSPPQLPWLMSVNSDTNHDVIFHAIFSNKSFFFSFRGESIRNNKRKALDQNQRKFSFVATTKPESYKKEFNNETVFQIMFDHHGSNKSGHEFIPPAPIGNLPKFYSSILSDEIKKRLTVVVPCMKFSAHYMGKNFQFERGGMSLILEVTDDRTKEVITRIPCPDKGKARNYLISSNNGLLMVLKNHVPSEDGGVQYKHKYQFLVYGLENLFKEPYWTKLSGIGDTILFLDYNNGFSLTASKYDGVKGNCIYFISRLKKRSFQQKFSKRRKRIPESYPTVVACYDLGESKTSVVFSSEESCSFFAQFFFIPSLV